MKRLWICWLALIAFSGATYADYPDRPITIFYGGPAGSTGDIAARIVSKKMSESMGQNFVIDNRPGSQGLLAMQVAARAKPDGYTLLLGSVSSTVVAPAVRKVWPVDATVDFAPVSLVANSVLVVLVPKDSKFNSVNDLVKAAKAAPPKTISYANAASLNQLAMELFAQKAGIQLLDIPYRGPTEAVSDLVSGRLDVLPDSLGSATASIRSGRVRAIAVMSKTRTAQLPDVPTMAEQGYPDIVFGGTISLLAPAGTPREIIQRLNAEVAKAVGSDDVRHQLESAYLDPIFGTPDDYAAQMKKEKALFQKIATDAHIEKQ